MNIQTILSLVEKYGPETILIAIVVWLLLRSKIDININYPKK